MASKTRTPPGYVENPSRFTGHKETLSPQCYGRSLSSSYLLQKEISVQTMRVPVCVHNILKSLFFWMLISVFSEIYGQHFGRDMNDIHPFASCSPVHPSAHSSHADLAHPKRGKLNQLNRRKLCLPNPRAY